MKRWQLFGSLVTALAVLAGCAVLDEKQRSWIFQPSDRTWSGGLAAAQGMDDVWIDFRSQTSGNAARLHGLWLDAEDPATVLAARRGVDYSSGEGDGEAPVMRKVSHTAATAPLMLYLHGARYNVTGSAPRIRRMQELGFSVLAVDYRGFGKSTSELPSEQSAYEDARAAWDWLGKKYPQRQRYIYGHSLGGPIAINLAAEVGDESGTIVESTFTSIADVVSSSEWGWLPLSMLITQHFDAVNKVSKIGSPLLVVHGDNDRLILPGLGRKLYTAAAEPKRFVLVEGGSHHNTNLMGQAQYREAIAQLFQLN